MLSVYVYPFVSNHLCSGSYKRYRLDPEIDADGKEFYEFMTDSEGEYEEKF